MGEAQSDFPSSGFSSGLTANGVVSPNGGLESSPATMVGGDFDEVPYSTIGANALSRARSDRGVITRPIAMAMAASKESPITTDKREPLFTEWACGMLASASPASVITRAAWEASLLGAVALGWGVDGREGVCESEFRFVGCGVWSEATARGWRSTSQADRHWSSAADRRVEAICK